MRPCNRIDDNVIHAHEGALAEIRECIFLGWALVCVAVNETDIRMGAVVGAGRA